MVAGAANNLVSVAPSATSGVALISQGASANPAFGTVVIAGGGTGLASMTAYALLAGGTTSTGNLQQVASLGSIGEVLTSAGAGALPVWASAPIADLPWSVVTGATQAMAVDNGYVSANVTIPVAFTLPATAAVGSIIRVAGLAAGNGWTLAQNALQSIQIGSSVSTVGVGGSLASTNDNDCVHLLCAVADLTFLVISSMGNISIV